MKVAEIIKCNGWDLKCSEVGRNCDLRKRMKKDVRKNKC